MGMFGKDFGKAVNPQVVTCEELEKLNGKMDTLIELLQRMERRLEAIEKHTE